MTDPQEDTPCRDCKRPTQHATEICDDCRTPAGRLVTALAARGVKAKADSRCDVSVDILAITVDEEEWTISSVEATHAETVDAAANAIAAIVQAPGLRTSLTPTATGRALAILRAHTSSLDIVRAAQDVVEMLAATEARAVSAEAEVAQMEAERRSVIDGLIADVAAARRERDTLAAEVKRLREELEKPTTKT